MSWLASCVKEAILSKTTCLSFKAGSSFNCDRILATTDRLNDCRDSNWRTVALRDLPVSNLLPRGKSKPIERQRKLARIGHVLILGEELENSKDTFVPCRFCPRLETLSIAGFLCGLEALLATLGSLGLLSTQSKKFSPDFMHVHGREAGQRTVRVADEKCRTLLGNKKTCTGFRGVSTN